MIKYLLIGLLVPFMIYQFESFFQKMKIIKVDSVKLRKLKRIFEAASSKEVVSKAIRYSIEEHK